MSVEAWLHLAGVVVVSCPALLLAVMALAWLVNKPLSERALAVLTETLVVIGLGAAVSILAMMLASGRREVPVEIGNWVVLKEQHFHFHLKFVFDRLSVPFAILSFVLCGTIGAFTSRYLHRESGFRRFFLCYAIFMAGMVLSALAGTIETLFLGWELVGLASALLVAFYQERRNPVHNGLRVWSVYRFADAAFLIAAVTLHHLTGAGDFEVLMGAGAWPNGEASITASHALLVGLLLLIAAAGKSALVPFSGWLPRAMEGPTPSSAVFYGSLSVHLGAYLLLRVSPILDRSLALSVIVVCVGAATSLFAAAAARVQADIKSALAFASLTQVGLIVVEIGLGLNYLALVHLMGHACLRTLQLLRAPSLLQDYHELENAIGSGLPRSGIPRTGRLPAVVTDAIYHLAAERGFLDGLLDQYVVEPFLSVFRACNRWEQQWTRWIAGTSEIAGQPAPDSAPRPASAAVETPEEYQEPVTGRTH